MISTTALSLDILRLGRDDKAVAAAITTEPDAGKAAPPAFSMLLSTIEIVGDMDSDTTKHPAISIAAAPETLEEASLVGIDDDQESDPIAAIGLMLPAGVLPSEIKAASIVQRTANNRAPLDAKPQLAAITTDQPIVALATPTRDAIIVPVEPVDAVTPAPPSPMLPQKQGQNAQIIASQPISIDDQQVADADRGDEGKQPVSVAGNSAQRSAKVTREPAPFGAFVETKAPVSAILAKAGSKSPAVVADAAQPVNAAFTAIPATIFQPVAMQDAAMRNDAPSPVTASTQADLGAALADQAVDAKLDIARDDAWMDRVARDIAQLSGGKGRLAFQLNPENLGSLHVEVAHTSDGVALRFTTETEAARSAIVDAQHRLANEARAQGVRISETHTEFGNSNHGNENKGSHAHAEIFDRPHRVQDGEFTDDNAGSTQHGAPRDRFA